MPTYPMVASRGADPVGLDDAANAFFPAHGSLGTGTGPATSEALVELTARQTITWQSLSLNVASASGIGAGEWVFSARVNQVTDADVQVAPTAAGIIEDLTGVANLMSGDEYDWFSDNSGGMHGDAWRIDTVYSEFDTGATNESPIAVTSATPVTMTGVDFLKVGGLISTVSVEANTQYTARQPYIWANLRVYVASGGAQSDATVTARVDGVDDTTLQVTITATGVVEDLTGAIMVVAAEEINWESDEGTDTITLHNVSCTLGDTVRPLVQGAGWTTAGTEYIPVEGSFFLGTATEQDTQCTFNTSVTLQNAFAFLLSAAATGTATFRLNGASESDLALSLTATGIVEDLTGTVAVVATDEVGWIGEVSSGSASTTLVAVEAETGAAPPAASLIYDPHRPRRVMLTR